MHEYLGDLQDVPKPLPLEDSATYTLPLLWLAPGAAVQPHQLYPLVLDEPEDGHWRVEAPDAYDHWRGGFRFDVPQVLHTPAR
jgi:hypothetical protein